MYISIGENFNEGFIWIWLFIISQYYHDCNFFIQTEIDEDTLGGAVCLEFHGNHGKNVLLSNHNLTACRTASYNQGIVVSHKPLPRNQLVQVII